MGKPILDKIRTFTDKPVTTIINTHTHGYHVSGNVEFPSTVEVVVQENTKSNMERMERRDPRPTETRESLDILKTNNHTGMPTRTFKDAMSIAGGPISSICIISASGTRMAIWWSSPLCASCTRATSSPEDLPNIDLVNGGSGLEWGNTLAKAHSGIKYVDAIITGHSTLMSMQDLKEHSDFLREFASAVREAKKNREDRGRRRQNMDHPCEYKNYPSPRPEQLRTPVQTIYDELK